MSRVVLALIALLLSPSLQHDVFSIAEASKKSKRNAKRAPKANRQPRPSSTHSTSSRSATKNNRLSQVSPGNRQNIKPGSFLTVAQVRSRVVSIYQKAAVGRLKNPAEHLRAEFGEALWSPESEAGLSELEDDVLDLLRIPPKQRNSMWKEIEAAVLEKYDLDKQAWLTVYGFYAEQVFGNDVQIVGNRQNKIRTHFESLRRSLSLSEPRNPTQKRYLYYLANLRRNNAAEMAIELGTSQARVYADLSVLSLSREAAFAEVPSKVQQSRIVKRLKRAKTPIEGCESDCKISFLQLAKKLFKKGWSKNQIAEVLSLGGPGALNYFLHPNGIPRGSEWTGKVDLGQGPVAEEAALLQLHGRGLPAKDIAGRLNRAKRVTDPNSVRYRTQKSVQAKLNDMGVRTHKSSKYPQDHKIKKYGLVKESGELSVEKAKKFIYDHIRSQTIPEMAANLAVSANTLRRFIAKHHLPSPSSSPDRESNDTEVKKRIATTVKQYKSDAPSKLPASLTRHRRTFAEALENMIARIEHHGKTPPYKRKPSTQEEKADTAAYKLIYSREWTEAEIEALPVLPQAVIRAHLKSRKEGEGGRRTAKEALENAIARIERHGKAPPYKRKPSTPEEKADNAAYAFLRRHEWTQAEIDALPDVSREVVTKFIEERQRREAAKTSK